MWQRLNQDSEPAPSRPTPDQLSHQNHRHHAEFTVPEMYGCVPIEERLLSHSISNHLVFSTSNRGAFLSGLDPKNPRMIQVPPPIKSAQLEGEAEKWKTLCRELDKEQLDACDGKEQCAHHPNVNASNCPGIKYRELLARFHSQLSKLIASIGEENTTVGNRTCTDDDGRTYFRTRPAQCLMSECSLNASPCSDCLEKENAIRVHIKLDRKPVEDKCHTLVTRLVFGAKARHWATKLNHHDAFADGGPNLSRRISVANAERPNAAHLDWPRTKHPCDFCHELIQATPEERHVCDRGSLDAQPLTSEYEAVLARFQSENRCRTPECHHKTSEPGFEPSITFQQLLLRLRRNLLD
ncbi:hypothetical protein T439DRAFT_357313 [Meredithblackwellia eburnea MCA 4105]